MTRCWEFSLIMKKREWGSFLSHYNLVAEVTSLLVLVCQARLLTVD